MVSPALKIGLVPTAVGGTALRRWIKGGDLYEQAVARARVAAQTGVIRGVLWHQGESDAKTHTCTSPRPQRVSWAGVTRVPCWSCRRTRPVQAVPCRGADHVC